MTAAIASSTSLTEWPRLARGRGVIGTEHREIGLGPLDGHHLEAAPYQKVGFRCGVAEEYELMRRILSQMCLSGFDDPS